MMILNMLVCVEVEDLPDLDSTAMRPSLANPGIQWAGLRHGRHDSCRLGSG